MAGPPAAITLPSGFWLDGRHHRYLQLRPVSAVDAALTLDAEAELNPAARATALLARHVVTPDGSSLDPVDVARVLSAGDREALLLHLRRNTFGEHLDCLVRCPATQCGQLVSVQLRVSDLLLPHYENPQPSYELEASHAGIVYRVRFRLPSGTDLEAAAGAMERSPQVATQMLVRTCLQEVNPAPSAEAADALAFALESDLSRAAVEHDPQAELQLELECPACGTAFSTVFDTAAYLLEELERDGAATQCEVEALAFHYHWSERDILGMTRARRQRYLDLLAQRFDAEAKP